MGRLLIVDDDPEFVDLVKAYLQDTSHEVLSAKDPYEANEVLDTFRVDLALVDINLPYENGFEFAKNLKNRIRHKFLPICFITSRNQKHDIDRAIELKVDGYIMKPIQKKEFIEKIESIMKRAAPAERISLDIDKFSNLHKAELTYTINCRLISISELGVVIETDKRVDQDALAQVKSYLFTLIGIEPPQFKIIKQTTAPTKGYTSVLQFNRLSQEDLGKLIEYLKTNQDKGPIKES